MRKLILTTVVLAGIVGTAPNAQAGIFGRWFRRPVMAQPASVVVTEQTGYRAFTYQPGPTVYQPARVNRVNPVEQRQFHNAAGKILGTAY